MEKLVCMWSCYAPSGDIPCPSCPRSTRASIPGRARHSQGEMDCRVEPGNDDLIGPGEIMSHHPSHTRIDTARVDDAFWIEALLDALPQPRDTLLWRVAARDRCAPPPPRPAQRRLAPPHPHPPPPNPLVAP